MLKKVKQSKSEKILLSFLVLLAFFSLSSFFIIKNKCLFVEDVNIKKLNFNKPTSNSMDAVSDRDYALEFMFVCSINAMHLSRFAEEIIIWNSDIEIKT